MNLLLDTHVLLWWLSNNPRLGKQSKAQIRDPDAMVWISSASVWEIGIKQALGRLEWDGSEDALQVEMEQSGFRSLEIGFQHAWKASALPLHHSDPFDRMLIAQAQCEGLTLMTVDSAIRAYDVPTLDASL